MPAGAAKGRCAARGYFATAASVAQVSCMPPALSGMVEFPTSVITEGTALYGGFAEAVIIGMRQDLRVEVLRFADAGRYQHEVIAHMRADGYVAQPGRLFKQLATA